MNYRVNIGLEVHLQLSTKTKVFCPCPNKFGGEPNSQTCPVCLGLPGSLPVLNKVALDYAFRVAAALNCAISHYTKFDRKNYYYPDLPKNFQISQYDKPIALNGNVRIKIKDGIKTIRIRRVHLEEDAGKLIHKGNYSLIDYNRAGTPLLEIVTEPDISSPEEAYDYLSELKAAIRYLNVSDCNMEEGSLRCDANISLAEASSKELGVKTELKNMNSFKGVRAALEFEIIRQAELLDEDEKIVQETRLWNADKSITTLMRTKEDAHDYRYFPEPDLLPATITTEEIEKIKSELPELPGARKERFVSEYNISEYDAGVLTCEKSMADLFESTVKIYNNPKGITNWIMGDVSRVLNESGITINATRLKPENLAKLVELIDSEIISVKIAKAILPDMISFGEKPDSLVKKKGLSQISDKGELEHIIAGIINNNKKSVSDYKSGKKNAMTFLVGQVMKTTKGKANPQLVNEILKNMIK